MGCMLYFFSSPTVCITSTTVKIDTLKGWFIWRCASCNILKLLSLFRLIIMFKFLLCCSGNSCRILWQFNPFIFLTSCLKIFYDLNCVDFSLRDCTIVCVMISFPIFSSAIYMFWICSYFFVAGGFLFCIYFRIFSCSLFAILELTKRS